MLRTVRSHLDRCAEKLGTPLEDIFHLDATSIRLLPPAFAAEIQDIGYESRWTPQLFAQEVGRLREQVIFLCSHSAFELLFLIDFQTDFLTFQLRFFKALNSQNFVFLKRF